MIGLGNYGEIARQLLDELKAHGIILVVLNGARGNGISVCGPAVLHEQFPAFLAALARDLEVKAKTDASAIRMGEAALTDTKQ